MFFFLPKTAKICFTISRFNFFWRNAWKFYSEVSCLKLALNDVYIELTTNDDSPPLTVSYSEAILLVASKKEEKMRLRPNDSLLLSAEQVMIDLIASRYLPTN